MSRELKKPTKAEVRKAEKVIERYDEWERNQMMSCQCPEGLQTGRDGFIHRTPLDCCTSPEGILATYNDRIEYFEERKKESIKSYNEKIKKLKSLKDEYEKGIQKLNQN